MYTRQDILDKLEIYKDSRFKFDAPTHIYTYQEVVYISVTTFISKFYKKFDSEYHSLRSAVKNGVTQDEILQQWEEKAERACELGTMVHLWIENYYNNVYQPLPNDLDVIHRINKFNIMYATHLYKLEHIKSEQMIFSKKWKIAGMIDTLFLYRGSVVIIDYKSNGKLTTDLDTKYNRLLYPFSKYWDNDFNKYSIQQSLYTLILEEIGIEVKVCYLLYIGPDEPAKLLKCNDMRLELREYFNKPIIEDLDIDDIGLEFI